MRLKHFSVIFSIGGILILYTVTFLSQTPFVEISEIQNYEGKQITTQGTVKDHHFTSYGTQIITIENNNITATVFVEGKTEVEYGDRIQATGEVQKYKDRWEIVINDKSFINILEKWYNISFPMWQLSENPNRYIGINVNVTGYIDTVYDTYFNLIDFDKKCSIAVFYNHDSNITLYSNLNEVSVAGKFLFDDKNMRYKIDICDENHGVFTVAR